MKPEIIIFLDSEGIREILLKAESERECMKIMETYKKFEPEILNFICAVRKQANSDKELAA